jgi:hypothetical protein
MGTAIAFYKKGIVNVETIKPRPTDRKRKLLVAATRNLEDA